MIGAPPPYETLWKAPRTLDAALWRGPDVDTKGRLRVKKAQSRACAGDRLGDCCRAKTTQCTTAMRKCGRCRTVW